MCNIDSNSIIANGNNIFNKEFNKETKKVSESIKIIEEHEYVDLRLPSGILWSTCNIGAESPEKFGDFFAWGETRPKNLFNRQTYAFAKDDNEQLTKYNELDGMTNLLPEDDAASVLWGGGWRMPTIEEWRELEENTNNSWITYHGMRGMFFEDKTHNGKRLFLPAAGFYWGETYHNAEHDLCYWSSSLDTNKSIAKFFTNIIILDWCGHNFKRPDGFCIRPVHSAIVK